jgi:hypothetical protein
MLGFRRAYELQNRPHPDARKKAYWMGGRHAITMPPKTMRQLFVTYGALLA